MTRMKYELPSYTRGEELLNSISHGVGTAFGIAALVLCIVQAVRRGDAWSVVSACVYGTSLILLYGMSTLYHAVTHKKLRRIFRVFDHTSIFLLIAGTYTPLTLITLRGALGWVMFGVVWGGAVLGIVLNSVDIERFRRFSMVCYLMMGWMIAVGVVPLVRSMKPAGILFLVLGGICYTVGVFFYRRKKIPFMHGVWHLFVLAGSVCHFFCIIFYVLPTRLP